VLFRVLDDPGLHTFIGGQPRTRDELARWIGVVASGGPPDGAERWYNWVVRRRDDDEVVGTVQATVVGDEASIAWVTGSAFQGSGFAKEAAAAMVEWLRSLGGVTKLRAEIHPDHLASQAVARSLGLAPTDELDDGEIVWRDHPVDP
jgi:RimJ/RimL family protein N-acetyltransferase